MRRDREQGRKGCRRHGRCQVVVAEESPRLLLTDSPARICKPSPPCLATVEQISSNDLPRLRLAPLGQQGRLFGPVLLGVLDGAVGPAREAACRGWEKGSTRRSGGVSGRRLYRGTTRTAGQAWRAEHANAPRTARNRRRRAARRLAAGCGRRGSGGVASRTSDEREARA